MKMLSKPLIGTIKYKFNEWTKKHVGIASRAGSKERYALWSFLVAAKDVNIAPIIPLIIDGDEIRDATISFQEFNIGVSRLVKLQQEIDKKA